MTRVVSIAALLAVLVTACAEDGSGGEPEASATTMSLPDDSVVPAQGSTTSAPADDRDPRPAVAEVRLRGSLASVGDGLLRLCREASASSCSDSILLAGVTWDDVALTPFDEAWGRWHPDRVEVDGTMRSDGSVDVTETRLELAFVAEPANPCPQRTAAYPTVGPDADEVTRQIIEYTLTIRDRLGGEITWDSRRGIRIIRVIDEPVPHQAALDAVAPDQTCVIQVANGRHELGLLRMRLEALEDEWEERGYGVRRVADRTGTNLVAVEVASIDARMWDDVGNDRELVWMQAHVEVLGGADVAVLDTIERQPLVADARRLFVSCRRLPVDPAIFAEPADDHLDGHPSNEVFEQIAMPGVPQPGDVIGWWRAYESPARVLLVNESMGALEVVDFGGSWGWAGSGSCQLEVLDPLEMLLLRWDRDRAVDLGGNDLSLVVHAPGCPGTSPSDLDVLLDEADDQVVITVLRRPFESTNICLFSDGPAQTEVQITVTLSSPLGDRELVDGSVADVS